LEIERIRGGVRSFSHGNTRAFSTGEFSRAAERNAEKSRRHSICVTESSIDLTVALALDVG